MLLMLCSLVVVLVIVALITPSLVCCFLFLLFVFRYKMSNTVFQETGWPKAGTASG